MSRGSNTIEPRSMASERDMKAACAEEGEDGVEGEADVAEDEGEDNESRRLPPSARVKQAHNINT
jgi:hypothetical protein